MDEEYRNLLYHEIDWNMWHKKVDDSMAGFSFDEAADLCNVLGLDEMDGDDTTYDVKGAALYREVLHMVKILIAMKETDWEPSDKNGLMNIYRNCYAYVDDGLYLAELKFRYKTDRHVQEPFIRVTLTKDNNFIIEFIVLDQFF
jgi:hypothetical protein